MSRFVIQYPLCAPGTESAFSSSIPFSDYCGHLTDQALLSVTVLALVEGTNQSWVSKKTVPLQKPSITITVTKGKTKTGLLLHTNVQHYTCTLASIVASQPQKYRKGGIDQ